MSLFLLDTDHISLALRGHPTVVDRLSHLRKSQWAVSIISVQESFNGWIVSLNDPRYKERQVELYTRLWHSNNFFQRAQVLNFDTTADGIYQGLLQSQPALSKRRMEKDIKIASVALANQAIVITRNRRDFEQVPGLQLEDWS
ncbi:type II toxin-antitoxin system VapC family toxin [filamentous cyanobacterium LEGE 11480]|uniref:Type II toxin-antitoxin system VapC family toxin n=1 Tax=Romeriopsis navalis LEGE 11480 TaxID=2777977 RepID=A0A928VPH1_9CYAN|nr:type II toxin-antitoxin system VapC family toxin [Romeriopsis navalis]MBE9032383.1 type II toxin-antitoxin system VapC family toxin [Romeriopsis navalis LEGE 11480]